MSNKAVRKRTDGLEQQFRGQSSSMTPNGNANSFYAALDVILSCSSTSDAWNDEIQLSKGDLDAEDEGLDREDLRALRLTSKAARSLVDYHIQYLFLFDDHAYSLDDLSPWPWPSIYYLSMRTRMEGSRGDKRDIERLVTLPLPELRSLTLWCHNIAPLAHNSWPELTNLELHLKPEGPKMQYRKDLKFPKWALKSLDLDAGDDDNDQTLAFLGPLLEASPELTHFKIDLFNGCTKKVAEMIVSASLVHLERLEIKEYETDTGFYPTLLDWSWPALTSIIIGQTVRGTLPLLTSKSWLKNLKEIELKQIKNSSVAELRAFLQALENGAIERLSLEVLYCSYLVEAFSGIQFEHLKSLTLDYIKILDLGRGTDVSKYLNVLFDTCSLPKLENIYILIDLDENEELHGEDSDDDDLYIVTEEMPTWIRPPNTSVTHLTDSFPLLKKISLNSIWLSRAVTDVLGDFRRQTGCKIDAVGNVYECFVPEKKLSSERRSLLKKLNIDEFTWKVYTKDEIYEDCAYWDTLSDDTFKRAAYALALDQNKAKKQLDSILKIIQADLKSSDNGNTRDALKNFLVKLLEDSSQYISLDFDDPQLPRSIEYLIEQKIK